eukprot:SAG31_NODE_30508_length_380_cov_0.736655_1_plen_99_part_10
MMVRAGLQRRTAFRLAMVRRLWCLLCVLLPSSPRIDASVHAARRVEAPQAEEHLSCGGNYGWMRTEEPWMGKPCPPPAWEPVWQLNLSTTPATPWGPEI